MGDLDPFDIGVGGDLENLFDPLYLEVKGDLETVLPGGDLEGDDLRPVFPLGDLDDRNLDLTYFFVSLYHEEEWEGLEDERECLVAPLDLEDCELEFVARGERDRDEAEEHSDSELSDSSSLSLDVFLV